MPIPPIKRNLRRTIGAKIQLILSSPRCCRQNKTTNIIMATTRTISVQEKIKYTVRAKSPKLVEHWKIRRRGNRLATGTRASGYLFSEQGDTTTHLRMAQLDSLNSRQNCKRWYSQHLLKRILANKSKKTGIKSWNPENLKWPEWEFHPRSPCRCLQEREQEVNSSWMYDFPTISWSLQQRIFHEMWNDYKLLVSHQNGLGWVSSSLLHVGRAANKEQMFLLHQKEDKRSEKFNGFISICLRLLYLVHYHLPYKQWKHISGEGLEWENI